MMATSKAAEAAEVSPAKTPSVLRFDEDGDLQLEVGQGASKKIFLVCSRSLSRVSKPLKAMLYGDLAESKPRNQDDQWKVNLPEDNATAFIPILRIIHHKFRKIPKTVPRDKLYHICVLADKYDMVELLVNWASEWIRPFAAQSTFSEQDERLLWISWVLGHYELFCKVVRHLISSCTAFGGKLYCPSGEVLDDDVYIKSMKLTEVIESQRKALLEKLNMAVQNIMDTLLLDGKTNLRKPGMLPNCWSTGPISEQCQMYHLGLLMRTLLKNNAYPLTPAPDTGLSFHIARTHLVSLCDCTVAIKTHNLSIFDKESRHVLCNPGPKLKETVMAMEPTWVPDHAQIRKLNQQARKCGLPINEDLEASALLSQSLGELSMASGSLFGARSGRVSATFGGFQGQSSLWGTRAQPTRAPSSSINAGMGQAASATTGGQPSGPAPALFGAAT